MRNTTEQDLISLRDQLDWYRAGVELMAAQVLSGGHVADNGRCLGPIYDRYVALRRHSGLDVARLLSAHLDLVNALLQLSGAAGAQDAHTAVQTLAQRRRRHHEAYLRLRDSLTPTAG